MRGHHIYQEEWEAAISEELQCEREKKNAKDPYSAVAVVRDNVIVGHLPRKISRTSALFIKRKGKIRCKVVGTRRYFVDLPQGGLEIPCLMYTRAKIIRVENFRVLNFRCLPTPTKIF